MTPILELTRINGADMGEQVRILTSEPTRSFGDLRTTSNADADRLSRQQ